jgi:hypothetical protein
LRDKQKAWQHINEAHEIDISLYGPDHPETQMDKMIMSALDMLRLD